MKRSERFPSRFVKAADLPQGGKVVRIDRLEMEEVGQGKDKEIKPVLYFKNATKVLVLNSTNDEQIGKLLGSDDDRDWGGGKICLYPTVTKFGKDMVDCIRIRAVDGEAKEAKTKTTESDAESENPAPSESRPLPSKDESDVDVDLDDEIPF
jgi:hypothetical protein